MDPREFWEGMNAYLDQRPIFLTDEEMRNPLILIENICSRGTLHNQRNIIYEMLHTVEGFSKLGTDRNFKRHHTTMELLSLLEACHRFSDLKRVGRVEYSITYL